MSEKKLGQLIGEILAKPVPETPVTPETSETRVGRYDEDLPYASEYCTFGVKTYNKCNCSVCWAFGYTTPR